MNILESPLLISVIFSIILTFIYYFSHKSLTEKYNELMEDKNHSIVLFNRCLVVFVIVGGTIYLSSLLLGNVSLSAKGQLLNLQNMPMLPTIR